MGVQINGDTGNISATKADYSGNVTIGGTLTYEDVTNVDSIGIVTAREGIEVGARPGVAASVSVDGNAIFSGIVTATSFVGDGTNLTNVGVDTAVVFTDKLSLGDNERVSLGIGSDLNLYHNSANNSSFIDNTTGDLNIRGGGGDILINPVNNETAIYAIANGKVQLRYDNSTKLETASGGVTVTGEVSATSFSGIGAITMVDAWGTSGGSNYSNNNEITNNWVRRTGTHGGNIGNAMTESSGVFTFPQTGLYYLSMQFGGYAYAGTQNYFGVRLMLSTNGGSSYSNVSDYYTSSQNSQYSRVVGQELLDVTSTSDFRVKFQIEVANDISIQGGQGRTSVIFVRYGDT